MITPRKLFGGLGNRLFQMAYLYGQVKKGTIPDYYVQDPKHFAHCVDDIRQVFGIGVKPLPYVSVHIRRGDYVNNPYYVDLTETDYYTKAIAQFPEETEFLVFCADRQEGSNDEADKGWALAYLESLGTGRTFNLAVGKDEISDFNMMAGCEGHICANSSFSWMAAFVGGGKTILPRAWYSSGRPGIPAFGDWILL